jgi:hypothetical protein
MLFGRSNLRRGWASEIQVESDASRTEDIYLGDLVGINSTTGVPTSPSDQAWAGNLEDTQKGFVAEFLGVALDKVLVFNDNAYHGGPRPVRFMVGTSGNYDFTIDPPNDDLPIGTLVGPAENEDGDGLLNDAVVVVADEDAAVGVVAEHTPAGSATVLVRIRSTVADRVLG